MIFIDTNEPKEIYELLKLAKVKVYRRKNTIEDYDFTVDYIVKGKITVAVERKTWEDLVASIEDGRYTKQRYILHKFFPLSFLVIVGNWDNVLKYRNITISSLIGVLYSTPLKTQGKVSVIQLPKIEDFILFLKLLDKTVENENFDAIPKPVVNKSDLDEVKIAMLACIPGIGTQTAKKLLKRFGSIKNIVNAKDIELKAVLGKKFDKFRSVIE